MAEVHVSLHNRWGGPVWTGNCHQTRNDQGGVSLAGGRTDFLGHSRKRLCRFRDCVSVRVPPSTQIRAHSAAPALLQGGVVRRGCRSVVGLRTFSELWSSDCGDIRDVHCWGPDRDTVPIRFCRRISRAESGLVVGRELRAAAVVGVTQNRPPQLPFPPRLVMLQE
jgi:hypothetical protein